jgi:hypothetical protein
MVPVVPAALVPVSASAQEIPVSLAVAALSPLLMIGFAIALGFLARSWRIGALHTGLVVFWAVLFVIAAQTTTNDYVIWTPIVLYGIHSILILILIGSWIARRTGAGRVARGE